MLQLLFVASFVCRFSGGLLCDCHSEVEHHHEVHHCCDCEVHAVDCSYHDLHLEAQKCHNHICIDDLLAQEPTLDLKSGRSTRAALDFAPFLACINHEYKSELVDDFGERIDRFAYQFSLSEWIVASGSLRAPPVLV